MHGAGRAGLRGDEGGGVIRSRHPKNGVWSRLCADRRTEAAGRGSEGPGAAQKPVSPDSAERETRCRDAGRGGLWRGRRADLSPAALKTPFSR